MPAILAILTFSKQMEINRDYIKDVRRDIYVKLTVEYSPNNWLLHADTVYTHEPTVTQVFAKRFSTNHRKENIIYTANREPVSLLISSYQLLCDHSRFNQQ